MVEQPNAIPIFLKDNAITKVVAFSGGAISAPPGFGDDVKKAMESAAKIFEESVIQETLERLCPYAGKLAILTGGTVYGVPGTASRIAKSLGFKTIGIFPETGHDKALGNDVLDLRICVDIRDDFECSTPEECSKFRSDWGDESAYFCKTLDSAVVFGGRAGTLVEVAHLLKMNERRKKYKQPPKFIVPIMASGGMGDIAPVLPADPDVRAWCLPSEVVRSGHKAAELLEEKLHLHDLLNTELKTAS
jgi:predicted Rossmann-fold nucleotide-binding protein